MIYLLTWNIAYIYNKIFTKISDINVKEHYCSGNKVCFDVNNLTPKYYKYLVWYY